MRADVIVVGLGSMGASAAYALAARGLRVIGLDRFTPPHDRGAHGGGRGDGATGKDRIRRCSQPQRRRWQRLRGIDQHRRRQSRRPAHLQNQNKEKISAATEWFHFARLPRTGFSDYVSQSR